MTDFHITTFRFSSSRQVRDSEEAQKRLRRGLDQGYSAQQLVGLIGGLSSVAGLIFGVVKKLPIVNLASTFVGIFSQMVPSIKSYHLSAMQDGINALGDLAYYMESNNVEAVEVDIAFRHFNHGGESVRYFCSVDYILKRIKKDGRWMLLT
ncbi:hypothetical protein ACLIA0_15095 [Bacillaceae bacterium W0354]